MSDLARALDRWRELARKKLPATDFEHPPTADGLRVRWLYTRADELAPDPAGSAARAPFVRGQRIAGAWDIRQEHGFPVRSDAADRIIEDLVGGVTSVLVRPDLAGRESRAPADPEFLSGRGRDGTAISTLDDLDEVLADVRLDLAPVALDAGAAAPAYAALLGALWRRRGHEPDSVRGAFRYDPLGALAETGLAPDDPLTSAGGFAAEADTLWPRATALAVDTRGYVGAGAGPVAELAFAIATATAYLRACEDSDLDAERAARTLEFTLQVDADQFTEIAKLRALRRLWARVLELCAVAPEERRSTLYARTSQSMLAAVDPWVNMLRTTTAAFAAAAGAADGISVTSFDRPRGLPGPLGRRIARNTHQVLAEEAFLTRVADPAGGSWYVESLTDQLAQLAWERVRAIERAGGMLAVLRSGAIARELAASAERAAGELARRERLMCGVNSFPLLGDDGLIAEPMPDLDALARVEQRRLVDRAEPSGRTVAPDIDALVRAEQRPPERAEPDEQNRAIGLARATELALAGTRSDRLAPAPVRLLSALPVARASEPFERLRAATSALGESGRVFLACVGPLARHGASAQWARNYFGSGGLQTVEVDAAPSARNASAALTAALDERGARIVVICAHDEEDESELSAAIDAARACATVARILLAQARDDRATELGADAGVRDGEDMITAIDELVTSLTAGQPDG